MCKCNITSDKKCACNTKGLICCSKQLSTNPTQRYDELFKELLEARLKAFLTIVRYDYQEHFGVPLSAVGLKEISNIVTKRLNDE